MKNKLLVVCAALVMIPAMIYAQSPGNFDTSLHNTREGKTTWYSAENGGFELLTSVPMDSLPCLGCHAPTLADGTPVDPATYEPGCADCHAVVGDTPAQTVCLGCHGRQNTEINLSKSTVPAVANLFHDVHRDDHGMVCVDCHTQREMHGDGTQYSSLSEPGAIDVNCTNEGCHPTEELVKNSAHNIHADKLYCNACHVKTVISCSNCHFETEVQADMKRFYGPPPMSGFVMLVNSEKHGNKVATAGFQSTTFGDTTFYAVAPFNGHTVTAEARDCDECHNSQIVQDYVNNGEIDVVRWDNSVSKLVNTKGVIPVPPDWSTALKMDFARFLGNVDDPLDNPLDPTKWEFMKSGADTTQMLFATPLTQEQMDKLATPVVTDFETSLHGSRVGKTTWYEGEGGFMEFTGVPMDSLPCLECHANNYADGTSVDVATYEPSCQDCHITNGDTPAQSVCLGCHSRQGAEIGLSGNPNPDVANLFHDVHRDDHSMVCTDCHSKEEMHGDGVEYTSMNDPGATKVFCTTCHPENSLPSNAEHDRHLDDLYCNACHVKTVVTCYNCHFETEVQAHKKRFYGPPPMNGFVMLVNSAKHDGKVSAASYQSLTWADTTFYAVGSFNGHTVTEQGRTCDDCHNTSIMQGYTSNGEIPVVQWDATESKLVHTKGVIPVPPDWKSALKMDFVAFNGNVEDPIDNPVDPTKWTLLKSGADNQQMLFDSPLTEEQMGYLAMDVTAVEEIPDVVPDEFTLAQNYPNPFNPATSIEFHLPQATKVTLKIYNILGKEVQTVVAGEKMNAGVYKVTFNAASLPSGIYVYRLETPEFKQARKMTLIK